jgi:hypothetical protein
MQMTPSSASKPLATISSRNLSEDFILQDKKGRREAEGYSLPSVLHDVLQGDDLVVIEKKR